MLYNTSHVSSRRVKCRPLAGTPSCQRIFTSSATSGTSVAKTFNFDEAGISSLAIIGPADSAFGNERGLFAGDDVFKGGTVFEIPLDLCLSIDYSSNNGVSLPKADWSRLKKGIAKDSALPWDILQSLAVLDASAGAGGDFWEHYSNLNLPQPLGVTLPFCMPERILLELGHQSIAQGAIAQKQRLKTLFPGLAVDMCDEGPTFLEWAMACVRSRAFKLEEDFFSFVPFLDLANHSTRSPNCNFVFDRDRGVVRLVAVADKIDAGAELTISYTGPSGYTNQRMMAQYGFVEPHGNFADRVDVYADADADADAPLLSLPTLQQCLGDGQGMAAALTGKDPYLYAALKSLPIAVDESSAGPKTQQQLAQMLAHQLDEEIATWKTSVLEDTHLLQATNDKRMRAAIQYRQQRKLLIKTSKILLDSFVKVII